MLENIAEEVDSGPNMLSNSSLQAEENSLDIETLLGQGSSANVYLARRRCVVDGNDARSKHVILKVLNKGATRSAQALLLLQKEADVMAALQGHPNIVGFHAFLWVENGIDDDNIRLPSWALQIEYCRGGDLHDKASEARFEESEAHPVMQGILRGLSHMHELSFVHRDIKPENVLWAEGKVKIADFGICCHTSNKDEMKKQCGSPGYIAPEIILNQPYGPNADCFSAGTLLYFIISGKLAFSGQDPRSALKKTVNRPLDFRRSLRLECLTETCKEFMSTLTKKDPLCRPSSKNALDSAWLSHGGGHLSHESQSSCDGRFSQGSQSAYENTNGYAREQQSEPENHECCATPPERPSEFSNLSTTYSPTTEAKANLSQERSTFGSKDTSTFGSKERSTIGSKERASFASAENEQSEVEVNADNTIPLTPLEPTRPEGRPGKSKIPFRSWVRQNFKPVSKGQRVDI
jgi:serine/threonine protein kinase